jgi:glycosyltransferase involved in cell wall biosynthesis
MKILNVNMTLDPVTGGGTAERTMQMSRALIKKGVRSSILTTDQGLTASVRNRLNGLEIFANRTLIKRFYIPQISFQQLKKVIAKFDIVHLMNHWTLLNVLVCHAARSMGKPYVVCPAGSLLVYGRSKLFKYMYNYLFGKTIITNASGHIAISINEIPLFGSYGIGPEKVSIIPNGINVQDFMDNDADAFRKKYGLKEIPFILFVGRLNGIKGPDLLLSAFCSIKDQYPQYHLVFIGPDGGKLQELKRTVSTCDIVGQVHFIGYIGGFEKSQAYHAADLLVIPSRHEAMSIVALEAGITGTAVMFTDQCGLDELSKIGGGKIVPATVEGIQSGLSEMLSDPEGIKSMGMKFREHVLDKYTWDAVADQYIELYKRILSRNLN